MFCPGVAKRTEAGPLLGDGGERVEQVPRRAREAVEPRHYQDVANALVEKYNEPIARHNQVLGRFYRNIAAVNPVGRPMATSEAQQAEILKHHKAGRSSRWIAKEMTLSRQAVMSVTGKFDKTDRSTAQRRLKLGLEPKIKDWRSGFAPCGSSCSLWSKKKPRRRHRENRRGIVSHASTLPCCAPSPAL